MQRKTTIQHEVNQRQKDPSTSCLIRSSCSTQVFSKVAILNDGSEQTMLLGSAAHVLGLNGAAESLIFKTVQQGTEGKGTVYLVVQSNPKHLSSIQHR